MKTSLVLEAGLAGLVLIGIGAVVAVGQQPRSKGIQPPATGAQPPSQPARPAVQPARPAAQPAAQPAERQLIERAENANQPRREGAETKTRYPPVTIPRSKKQVGTHGLRVHSGDRDVG